MTANLDFHYTISDIVMYKDYFYILVVNKIHMVKKKVTKVNDGIYRVDLVEQELIYDGYG